ncbi:MAG: DNRLRE domain-containing protein, partial [bacterium]
MSIADSYVNVSSPASNYGSEVTMHVDSTERSFLLFDLSTMPVGSNVASAELVLCDASILPLALGRTHELHRVGSAWTEAGLTWSNQPGGNPGDAIPFNVPLVELE